MSVCRVRVGLGVGNEVWEVGSVDKVKSYKNMMMFCLLFFSSLMMESIVLG